MAFQLSPVVSTTEKDLTTIIPQVSTTGGGYVGAFVWGPVKEVTLVDSENDLVSQFGEPDANTYKHFFTAANFLAYGNNLNLVRVVGPSAVNAVPGGAVTSVGGNSSSSSNSSSGSSSSLNSSSSSSSSSVTNSSSSSSNKTASSSSSSSSSSSQTNSSSSSSSSAGNDAVLVENRTHYDSLSGLAQVLIARYPGAYGNSLLVSFADSNTYEGWKATVSGDTYNLAAEFDGTPGTSDYVSSRGGSNDEFHIIILDKDGGITGSKGTILEKYAYVSKCSAARKADGTNNYYKEVLNESSRYVWWASHPSGGTNWGGAATLTFTSLSTVQSYNFTGGNDDNANVGNSQLTAGIDYLSDSETVDISLMLGGPANETVAEYVISTCESRGDCLGFLSPEESDVVNLTNIATQTSNVTAWRDVLPSTSYAVLDSGWKYQYDRYNDVYRWVPLNGDIAGLCARTDQTNDPWFSPAGLNRGQIKNVIKLAYNPRKAHRDSLYKKGINPVVSFPGKGTVLFGDRTLLSRPSAFREIGIRRLFIVLKKAITAAAEYSLFEFNDEFTRAQFRNMVEPHLRDVQGRRGCQEFLVVCDTTNNTGEVIDRNEFIGDIYIKPNHSINFVTLNFIATRTNVSFSEFGA